MSCLILSILSGVFPKPSMGTERVVIGLGGVMGGERLGWRLDCIAQVGLRGTVLGAIAVGASVGVGTFCFGALAFVEAEAGEGAWEGF